MADDKLFMLLLYLSLAILAQQILCLNCSDRGVSVPNYLVTNTRTNLSIVSIPYKYVIIHECSIMTVNYDKYNPLSLRECGSSNSSKQLTG